MASLRADPHEGHLSFGQLPGAPNGHRFLYPIREGSKCAFPRPDDDVWSYPIPNLALVQASRGQRPLAGPGIAVRFLPSCLTEVLDMHGIRLFGGIVFGCVWLGICSPARAQESICAGEKEAPQEFLKGRDLWLDGTKQISVDADRGIKTLQEAIRHLVVAYQECPNSTRVMYTLGEAYRSIGAAKEAYLFLKKSQDNIKAGVDWVPPEPTLSKLQKQLDGELSDLANTLSDNGFRAFAWEENSLGQWSESCRPLSGESPASHGAAFPAKVSFPIYWWYTLEDQKIPILCGAMTFYDLQQRTLDDPSVVQRSASGDGFSSTLYWVMLGVGAAAAITGGILGYVNWSNQKTYIDDNCYTGTCVANEIEATNPLINAGWAIGAGGGVLALTGAAFLLLEADSAAPAGASQWSSFSVAPAVQEDGFGVKLDFTF